MKLKLGPHLRGARELAGLSLRDVAAKLGVSHVFVREIEVGITFPSPVHLRRLAALLGLDVEPLLGVAAIEVAERAVERWRARGNGGAS